MYIIASFLRIAAEINFPPFLGLADPSAKNCPKGNAGDGLNPVNVLVHKHLSAGITLLAASQCSKRENSNLNIGSVRLFHNCGTSAVTIARPSTIAARGAHHCLRHDPKQPVTLTVVQNLNLDPSESIREDAVIVDHPPAQHCCI